MRVRGINKVYKILHSRLRNPLQSVIRRHNIIMDAVHLSLQMLPSGLHRMILRAILDAVFSPNQT